MAYIGGDIKSLEYSHEDLGSGTLYCKSNEDGTVDEGGWRINDDANQVAGDGVMILQRNRVRGSLECTMAWDMVSAETLDILTQMAASTVEADWTITHNSGAVWGGSGLPVGDIQGSTQNATISLKLAFSKLSKIS